MDEKEVVGRIVDSNGEFSELYPGDRVKVTRKESIEALERMKKKKAEECEPLDFQYYVKANPDELSLLLPMLKPNEKNLLMSIVPYIKYDSNLISYRNNKDIGTEELIDIAGVSKKTGYMVIESLVKKQILYRGDNGRNKQYFINPWLYARGNMKNKTLRAMFKNYRVLSHGGVPWGRMKADYET